MAVQLCFAQANGQMSASELLESFFDRTYYDTLSAEGESFSDYPGERQRDYIRAVVEGVEARREELDDSIQRFSKGWKVARISKTALAVLRVALFEILYVEDVPENVAISEAVELAKDYDVPETVSFINGVLGSFVRARHESSTEE
jgi:N utilization substance protein B